MKNLEQLAARLRRRVPLAPEQAKHLATVKLTCC
jgi:hypothetical protein